MLHMRYAKRTRHVKLNGLAVIKAWCIEEKQRCDTEIHRLGQFAPHLRDKPLCLASDSATFGLVVDKIDELAAI